MNRQCRRKRKRSKKKKKAKAKLAKKQDDFEKRHYERLSVVHAPGFQINDHLASRHRKSAAKPMKGQGDESLEARAEGKGSPEARTDGEESLDAHKDCVGSRMSIDAGVNDDDFGPYLDGGFVDREFPPCNRSLGAPMDEVDGWKRLATLHETPCLFDRTAPDDVFYQEFAGNLWFLSACAAAAEYPGWIQSMFGHTTDLSSVGRYTIRLYHPGQHRFVRVTVDDYVPTKGSSPTFAGITSSGQIWVALVEKAFAKLCASYAQTEWGLTVHGMHYVCGGSFGASWSRLGPSRWKRSCTVWNGAAGTTIVRAHAEGIAADGAWRDEYELWS